MRVTITFENGAERTASLEEWLVATIYVLPDTTRLRLVQRLDEQPPITPGDWVEGLVHALPPEMKVRIAERLLTQVPFRKKPDHYILHAEPGVIGLKL